MRKSPPRRTAAPMTSLKRARLRLEGQRKAKGPTGRQTSSRQAKARALDRIQRDTQEVSVGTMLPVLRRQGYEELPLDELQDRLSKLRTALAEFIVSRRS